MSNKDWLLGTEGKNLKFKRETLLNYGMNRWGLNKAHSVGSTSELIRACSPKKYDDWEKFYFTHAQQKKKSGHAITKDYIEGLGRILFQKLSENVHNELSSITEEECIEYVYNLVLNRTYEGYRTEIETIYGQLEAAVGQKIISAPDEWDRKYNVDFFIKIENKHIGIQIKPVGSGKSINDYQWNEMHEKNHEKFEKEFGGKVFFVYSEKSSSGKKQIQNIKVIDEIKKEIRRLT